MSRYELGQTPTTVQRAAMNRAPLAGVYAINHGHYVYVGEAQDIYARGTYAFAERLDLPRGIVVEMPGTSRREREVEEARVTALFARRGFCVVNDVKGSSSRAAKVSAALRGKPKTAEHRAALSAARLEMFRCRPDVLAALAERTAVRNRRGPNNATREKMRQARLGKITPAETRAKLSAAATRQHARRRQAA